LAILKENFALIETIVISNDGFLLDLFLQGRPNAFVKKTPSSKQLSSFKRSLSAEKTFWRQQMLL